MKFRGLLITATLSAVALAAPVQAAKNISILATGGTIAGSAETQTQAGYTSGQVGVDPKTGEVRASGTDDIAAWFVDTDYDEESFFVRHAYFLGQNDPYKSLKTTLKAEIDEEAWSSLRRGRLLLWLNAHISAFHSPSNLSCLNVNGL